MKQDDLKLPGLGPLTMLAHQVGGGAVSRESDPQNGLNSGGGGPTHKVKRP